MPPSSSSVGAIENEQELEECFACMSRAFGREKPLLNALHPDHDTESGRKRGVARLQAGWRERRDDPTFYYVKAVVEHDTIAGFAMWTLMTPKHGLTHEDAAEEFDLNALYPYDDDEGMQREWLRQVWRAYSQPRRAIVLDDVTDKRPVMVLELCVVHPDFQRRGIGASLTNWGIEEAKRVNARRAIVEASVPGVGCYARCGFTQQQPISFHDVEATLRAVRPFPTLTFMMTDIFYENTLTDDSCKSQRTLSKPA